MTRQGLLAAFRDGGPTVFGLSLRFNDPTLFEMIGTQWDFAWLDHQHGVFELADVAAFARVADLVDVGLLVRVGRDVELAARVLDLDVAGVIMAQVDDVDAARRVVAATRFPPVGDRSFGGRRIIDRRGPRYYERDEQLILCQIESLSAVLDAKAIALIDGIDGLMPGPDDLRLRRTETDPTVDQLVRTVAARATDAGRSWLAIAPDQDAVQAARDAGAAAISVTSDHLMVRSESLRWSESLRRELTAD